MSVTPMMSQWHECKKQAPGAVLLFRLGDFYEAFEDDALLLAKELEIVLTKRQETPMAGIPAHTCRNLHRPFGLQRLPRRCCRTDGRSQSR